MTGIGKFLQAAILVGGLAYSGAASAQEVPVTPPVNPGEVLNSDDMEHLTVGAGVDIVTITQQTLTAVNSGNSVSGDTVSSGDVNIGSDAFSGYSGLANFVINTGHNNNLQASMNLTIVLGPADPN